MCLIVALRDILADWPLIVAANRDEVLERPALNMTVLQEFQPRILGGKDLLAGGSWFSLNEWGVFAALVNVPASEVKPDSKRRSRGELPLKITSATSARAGVENLLTLHLGQYNPGRILAGDRDSLFYIDLAEPERPSVQELMLGRYALENRPLDSESPKSTAVLEHLSTLRLASADSLPPQLHSILGSHIIPATVGGSSSRRPIETEAPCVHYDGYGTRSSIIMMLPRKPHSQPRVFACDGPPCLAPLRDVTTLWL